MQKLFVPDLSNVSCIDSQLATYTHFRDSTSPTAFHTNCTLSNPLLHIHYYSFFHWLHFPPLPPCICPHLVHTSLLYLHSFLPHSLLQHNQDNLQQNISKHAICTEIHIKLDPNRKYCTDRIIFKGLPLPTFPDLTSPDSLWVLTFTGHSLIYCKSGCTHSSTFNFWIHVLLYPSWTIANNLVQWGNNLLLDNKTLPLY